MKTRLFSLIVLALVAGCGDVLPTARSADALDTTKLQPGHTLELKGAIPGELECVRYLATCQVDNPNFGVRTVAGVVPFSRGRGGLYRDYEFEVASGSGHGHVLAGQVCGAVEFNGFLGLIGGGQVSATLKMKLLDLGPVLAPYAEPRAVHCEPLADYSLQGKVIGGVGGGISGELGTTVTGGISLDLKFAIEIQKIVVRDEIEFGFQALFIRGHRYHLRCEAAAESKIDALTGFGIAQFMEGGPILNLMQPDNWRASLLSLLNSDLLPAFAAKTLTSEPISPTFRMPRLDVFDEGGTLGIFDKKKQEIEAATVALSQWTTRFVPNFADIHELLEARGLPVNLEGLIEIVSSHILQGIGSNLEELLEEPGVTVRRLSVTLQNDNTELLEAIRQDLGR